MVSTLKLPVGIEKIVKRNLILCIVKRVAENGVNSNNDCKEKFT